jgi:hypothetical protein
MKIAPTCFGLRPSSGSLYGAWLKLHYIMLGYVVVWQHVLGVACVLSRFCGVVAACLERDMCVGCCAEWDGRTPKHVGAIFMLFLM